MKTINGIYTSAKIFTTYNIKNNIDNYAISQIQMLCDNAASEGCTIRVMPDVHPGKVGTIGLTMTVGEKIMPNLVGIDIGCGMSLAQIKSKKIEFQKLDTVIRDNVPSGCAIRTKVHRFADEFDFSRLCCHRSVQINKARFSLGTLGGGNHFIELNQDEAKKVIIPINMRDGIILGTALGNAEWNYSAPHGAGRIMKREEVKSHFTVSNFKTEMKGIYTSNPAVDKPFHNYCFNQKAIILSHKKLTGDTVANIIVMTSPVSNCHFTTVSICSTINIFSEQSFSTSVFRVSAFSC